MKVRNYSEITPEILALTEICAKNDYIDPELYSKYQVKRGLRDLDGRGVLTGLTRVADVHAYEDIDGKKVPCEGRLFYRGMDLKDLVAGFTKEQRFGFEEITYLLLLGDLPTQKELASFEDVLASYRTLPQNFVRDVIMKAPSQDMMNTLARSVLMLYSYDETPDDISLANVMRQSLQLIAMFPLLAVYGYQAFRHYHDGQSLFIHNPQPHLSTAENILYLLRPDSQYTALEARVLDMALVLHADHGGGNNSNFTTHVVTSTGTDTYSAIAAALGALKGPRHGGANIKVVEMFDELKGAIKDWTDEEEVSNYLHKLLNKEAFDKSGLIYGIGHAVYSLSDPRTEVFRSFIADLANAKGAEYAAEYQLYATVERLGAEIIMAERQIYKGVSANVDFYSGFVYRMLDLPEELFTPLFAVARISGWSAHRLEELAGAGRIIRPAYKNIEERHAYIPMADR